MKYFVKFLYYKVMKDFEAIISSKDLAKLF